MVGIPGMKNSGNYLCDGFNGEHSARLCVCMVTENHASHNMGRQEAPHAVPELLMKLWSYGEKVYGICEKYMRLREKLRSYTRSLMEQAHKKGTPVMRPLFYDYPEDKECWEIEDTYMYGGNILVAPILYARQKAREIYLPKGDVWIDVWTGSKMEGGRKYIVNVVDEQIPVYVNKEELAGFWL